MLRVHVSPIAGRNYTSAGRRPCEVAAPPRLAETQFSRASWEEARLLHLWRETGGLTRSEGGPQSVVPLHAVPSTRADKRVVAKPIRDPVAQGAVALGGCNREAQAETQEEDAEELWLQ